MATTRTPRKTKAEVAHLENWTELTEKLSGIDPELYSIRGSFVADTLIDHPNFGLGVVTSSYPNKIEVCFEVGVKMLMHRKDN